jgi:ribosomal-protein-alanine N-acetyltransferase
MSHPKPSLRTPNGVHLTGFPAAIETDRFILRELTVADVSERYLEWLSDPEARKWIVAAAEAQRMADLKDYVAQRVGRADVLFLGIFDKSCGVHIGNIKYEPVLPDQGSAVMGILVGDPSFRGKGVFAEVFGASVAWLKNERRITRIHLGVEKAHEAALKAYQNAGFVPDLALQASIRQDVLMMVFYV